MSTVSLPTTVVTRARELFVSYSKKGAFRIEEYADVSAVFTRLTEAVKSETAHADVSEQDAKYLISAINVCSNRAPTEAINLKPEGELLEALTAAVKSEDEESKEEPLEKKLEKTSITEL
ncbi:hypothetical protein V7S43_006054 [Phytophthora oleae]|uniref:Uncharacterized protein n=1 Tax=Phytophthora oleae TaxID=2107226 RepID=A0ABD3FR36_9STRA